MKVIRRPLVALMLAVLAVAAQAPTSGAQEAPTRGQERQRATPRAPGRPGARDGAERAQLERRFRETLGRVVQRELGLTDAEAERLSRVNQQFDQRRRALLQQERDARLALRSQLQRGDAADDRRVAALLDEILRVQRGRVELQAGEQRELSRFLTPVQRARYLALQEGVRRRVDAQRGRGRERGQERGGNRDGNRVGGDGRSAGRSGSR